MVNQRHISPLLFLTPRLPGFVIGRRLNSHALELLQLDRALSRLGPHQLSDAELRQVSRSASAYSPAKHYLYDGHCSFLCELRVINTQYFPLSRLVM